MINKYLPILLCLLLSSSIACADSPFDDFFNPPAPPIIDDTQPPDMPEVTNTIPFNQAFLECVYAGEWVFSSPDSPFLSFEVLPPATDYAMNATECCGTWIARDMDTADIILEGLFCLQSTWDIRLRDKEETIEIKCIGVRGARMENPLHPALGWAFDNPTTIDCRTFMLRRIE